MSDLAHLRIWDDPAIRDSLSWYLEVAENRRPAKFRIASTVAAHIDPVASSEEALWAELDRLTPIFVRRCLSRARPLQFLSVECAVPSR
jgi:putative pyruvate formate lyase activating enzyme